jgi:hypothetical protein
MRLQPSKTGCENILCTSTRNIGHIDMSQSDQSVCRYFKYLQVGSFLPYCIQVFPVLVELSLPLSQLGLQGLEVLSQMVCKEIPDSLPLCTKGF